ncbi:MAG: hypothetical protein IK111_09920, partial [Lachnospiraceae bacterium]|nr:hypothetical protein [Lachnospiraceae bacterium]
MNKKGTRLFAAACACALALGSMGQAAYAGSLDGDNITYDIVTDDIFTNPDIRVNEGITPGDDLTTHDTLDNIDVISVTGDQAYDISNITGVTDDSGLIPGDDAIGIKDDTITAAAEGTDETVDECCDRLNKILDDKDVMAVLYLCDKYPLKDAPGEDAGTVCVVDCGTTLYLNSVTYLNGYWFDVTVYTESGEARGFVPMDKLICVDENYLKWEKGLLSAGDGAGTGDVLSKDGSTADGNVSDKTYTDAISVRARESVYSFPDSYRDKLFAILNKHPDWVFVPQKVGSTLSAAVSAELEDKNRNWVYYTVDDRFKGAKINSSWYYASRAGLEYYMNPANFVGSEQNIFMFEQLTYNASYHTQEGVQSVLKGSFMSGEIPSEGMTYAGAFYTIGSSLKVSPYHLAARVYQEQGSKGTSPLISGTYSGFEGYYNYFNIKASGSTNAEIYKNGLTYARQQGWNTRYKSLAGGSAFDSKNYILAGQDTPYLEKYNVVKKV